MITAGPFILLHNLLKKVFISWICNLYDGISYECIQDIHVLVDYYACTVNNLEGHGMSLP